MFSKWKKRFPWTISLKPSSPSFQSLSIRKICQELPYRMDKVKINKESRSDMRIIWYINLFGWLFVKSKVFEQLCTTAKFERCNSFYGFWWYSCRWWWWRHSLVLIGIHDHMDSEEDLVVPAGDVMDMADVDDPFFQLESCNDQQNIFFLNFHFLKKIEFKFWIKILWIFKFFCN